jgi:hypothetical protein
MEVKRTDANGNNPSDLGQADCITNAAQKTYTGAKLVNYDSTKKYYVKTHLVCIVNNQSMTVKSSEWIECISNEGNY